MKEKKQNEEEILDRRVFFKQAAKKVLPLLAITAIGTTMLSSCEEEDNLGCRGCGASCSGSCKDDCSGNCDAGCTGDCYTGCYGSCYKYSSSY